MPVNCHSCGPNTTPIRERRNLLKPRTEKARILRSFDLFLGANALSFILLSGNMVALYSLRLGATSAFIGVLGAFNNLAFIFGPLGRAILGTTPLPRHLGRFWVLRYLSMIFLLISPLAVMYRGTTTGLALIIISIFLFHFFRGIGTVAWNPLIGSVAKGRERGAILSRIQIIANIISIAATLVTAAFLGSEASLGRYSIFLGLGIVSGFYAAWLAFRLPDPDARAQTPRTRLSVSIRKALTETPFRRYLGVSTLLMFCSGGTISFLVLFAKKVYLQPDNITLLFTVAGSLGVITMGYLSRILLDRLGGKPILILFLGLLIIGILLIITAPAFTSIQAIAYLCLVFFLVNLGNSGAFNASQTYYYTLIPRSEYLNMGILVTMLNGIAGALGSLLGGILLQILESKTGEMSAAYRLYYGLCGVIGIIVIAGAARFKKIGKYSVRDSLSLIFSPRDLRGMVILNRMDKSRNADAEEGALKSLPGNLSPALLSEVLYKLKSPRYTVRREALQTIARLKPHPEITGSIIREIETHPFTTAAQAARIAGTVGLPRAIPALRSALKSPDYQLQSEALTALGRLGDRQSVPKIEIFLLQAENPRLQIHAATALALLGRRESIPVLIDCLSRPEPPAYLRDELILTMSEILEIGEWFFPLYRLYLNAADEAEEELLEELKPLGAEKIERIAVFLREGNDPYPVAALLKERKQLEFAESTANSTLMQLERYRFFLGAVLKG